MTYFSDAYGVEFIAVARPFVLLKQLRAGNSGLPLSVSSRTVCSHFFCTSISLDSAYIAWANPFADHHHCVSKK